jgi:hypothetical protein
MNQVDNIRNCAIRSLDRLWIYISCLDPREEEALRRIAPDQRAATVAKITDAILEALGHEPDHKRHGREAANGSNTQSARAAQKHFKALRGASLGE